MKKFLLKIFQYIGLVFLVVIMPAVIIYYCLPVNYPINGLASTLDKHKRLENIASPKIVIVGGSGCGMGINSQMIDSAFPGYEVVNMGLFGQLGLLYMMNEVKDEIREGDIIVIVPEYQHFYYQYYGDRGMMRTVKMYPQGLSYLSHWKQWMVVAENLGPYLPTQFIKNDENPDSIAPMWNRKFVNEYGDFCGHLDQPDTFDVCQMPLFKQAAILNFDHNVIDDLNDFSSDMRAKHAEAVFMFPAIPICTFDANDSVIGRVDSILRADCTVPIVNTTTFSVFPDSLFYDTVYHMNKNGRETRTLQFIADLRKYISKKGDHF